MLSVATLTFNLVVHVQIFVATHVQEIQLAREIFTTIIIYPSDGITRK